MAQPRHYSVVLAVIAREVDKGHWDPRFVEKGLKNLKAIIDAAVIDEYDFVPPRDREVLKRADEFRDATRAIEDRDHDREGETRCSLSARLAGLNHRQSLPWQRLREPTRRTGTSIPLARGWFRGLSRHDRPCRLGDGAR